VFPSLDTIVSIYAPSFGIMMESPRIDIIATDMYLSHSVSNGMTRTIYAMERVSIEKLMMIPNVTPSGRLLPPVAADDKTMGRMGQIQGAAMVTSPDTKAKNSKIIIIYLNSKIWVLLPSVSFQRNVYDK